MFGGPAWRLLVGTTTAIRGIGFQGTQGRGQRCIFFDKCTDRRAEFLKLVDGVPSAFRLDEIAPPAEAQIPSRAQFKMPGISPTRRLRASLHVRGKHRVDGNDDEST